MLWLGADWVLTLLNSLTQARTDFSNRDAKLGNMFIRWWGGTKPAVLYFKHGTERLLFCLNELAIWWTDFESSCWKKIVVIKWYGVL